MLKKSDLQFDYPERLIAREPKAPPRVLWAGAGVDVQPAEISFAELLARIPAGDLLLINNTKVNRRRVFAGANGDLEILFLNEVEPQIWEVLFPSRNHKLGEEIPMPEGLTATFVQKGRPQRLRLSAPVQESYFEQHGELPLPPYIQAAREDRHNRDTDESWYQTAWAKQSGSLAAPTASLHFSADDLLQLKNKGVAIAELTLHVGLGTFLPLSADLLTDHKMHFESVFIPNEAVQKIEKARADGSGVWALGTTVARSVESYAREMLRETDEGFAGETDLFLYPGQEFKIVNRLMTNFHQPESTLLALVGAFYGLDRVKTFYQWAIEKEFRLFSYGDLSVWNK